MKGVWLIYFLTEIDFLKTRIWQHMNQSKLCYKSSSKICGK